jgi:hypothetical protein
MINLNENKPGTPIPNWREKNELRFRKTAFKRLFLVPFHLIFSSLFRISLTKALKKGYIRIFYITPKSDIDNVEKPIDEEGIKLNVLVPTFLFKTHWYDIIHNNPDDFKYLVKARFESHQNLWYDTAMNIEFLGKDLMLHWDCKKGRGHLRINESLHGLTKDELDKIMSLHSIQGISDQDRESKQRELQKIVYVFVMRKCPWILQFTYPPEYGDEWITPFASYFTHDAPSNAADWLYDFNRVVEDQLKMYQHWINEDPRNLKMAAKYNRCWIKRFKLARDIKRKYPTFERDLQNLYEYLQTLFRKTSTSPINPQNYPLYVSLYLISREFGGHEEGGWWYDWWTHNNSIKVNNYKEARVAAVHLLKNSNIGRDFEGVQIILEKEPKSEETKERPHYS